MPRKRIATIDRAEPAQRRLVEALHRLPAAAAYLATLGAARSFLAIPENSPLLEETVGWWILSAHKTALDVCRDPTLQGYFRGRNRVDHARWWIQKFSLVHCGVNPEQIARDFQVPMYVWTPRGPRPQLNDGLAERLDTARARLAKDYPGIEPTQKQLARAVGLSTRELRRRLNTTRERDELVSALGPEKMFHSVSGRG